MELEERKAMLDFLRNVYDIIYAIVIYYIYFTGSIEINNQAMNEITTDTND